MKTPKTILAYILDLHSSIPREMRDDEANADKYKLLMTEQDFNVAVAQAAKEGAWCEVRDAPYYFLGIEVQFDEGADPPYLTFRKSTSETQQIHHPRKHRIDLIRKK